LLPAAALEAVARTHQLTAAAASAQLGLRPCDTCKAGRRMAFWDVALMGQVLLALQGCRRLTAGGAERCMRGTRNPRTSAPGRPSEKASPPRGVLLRAGSTSGATPQAGRLLLLAWWPTKTLGAARQAGRRRTAAALRRVMCALCCSCCCCGCWRRALHTDCCCHWCSALQLHRTPLHVHAQRASCGRAPTHPPHTHTVTAAGHLCV
jgi:hypothetical protein